MFHRDDLSLRNEIMSARESQAILDATAQVKADSAPIELADRKRLRALLSAQRRSPQLNGPNHFLPSRSFLPVARSGHSHHRPRKLSQLQDNLASFDLTLSSDQVKTLDEASRIELGFPYDLYRRELPRTFMYGGMGDQILS